MDKINNYDHGVFDEPDFGGDVVWDENGFMYVRDDSINMPIGPRRPLQLKRDSKVREWLKIIRGLFEQSGNSMVEGKDIRTFVEQASRRNYYGILRPNQPGINFNYACVPHPSAEVREMIASTKDRLKTLTLSAEQREVNLQRARELACSMINHLDPRGVILAHNTTQALSYFHWLSGMHHSKNRAGLLAHVLTTNIENSATYRTICTIGEDGNTHQRDPLTTFSNHQYGTQQVTDRHTALVTFHTVNVRGQSLESMKQQLAYQLKRRIRKNRMPDALVISHVDRVTGRVLPVKELAAYAKKLKAEAEPRYPNLFVVADGAQAWGNITVDWQELGVDMYVGSPHKTMGAERLGIAFFDPDNPIIHEGIELMRAMDARTQPIYYGNFHPEWNLRNVPVDANSRSSIGETRAEVNPIEVASFIAAGEELQREQLFIGNDCTPLANLRDEKREYCKKQLAELARTTGLPITVPDIQDPSSFILAFRVGPDTPIERKNPWWNVLLPPLFKRPEPEQIGHEIARKLKEANVAASYFYDDNVFRVSFDRPTSTEDIDALMAKLEAVLRTIPEVQALTKPASSVQPHNQSHSPAPAALPQSRPSQKLHS